MKKVLFGLVTGLMLMAGMAAVQPVWAADSVCQDTSIPAELREQAGCNMTEDDTADKYAGNAINVVLSVVGVVAVIMIIIGGIMYIISTGDAAKVNRAKNIILYSIVGLVVSLLAYAIVNFVVKGVSGGK